MRYLMEGYEDERRAASSCFGGCGVFPRICVGCLSSLLANRRPWMPSNALLAPSTDKNRTNAFPDNAIIFAGCMFALRTTLPIQLQPYITGQEEARQTLAPSDGAHQAKGGLHDRLAEWSGGDGTDTKWLRPIAVLTE